MSAKLVESFEVINVDTRQRTTLTRTRPLVGGVPMLAPSAETPDGALVTKFDDGMYGTDDGRRFRDADPL